MKQSQLEKFISFLLEKNYDVLAPQKKAEGVVIEKIYDPKKAKMISKLPLHSFKQFVLPPKEELFTYKNKKMDDLALLEIPNRALFGLSILDLRALALLNQVLKRDPYYQARMRKTLVMGQSCLQKDGHEFCIPFDEENILEHVHFDILVHGLGPYKIYTGTRKGQRILEDFGYKDYEHIQFAGPIKEEGVSAFLLKLRDKMVKSRGGEIWKKLGKRCIECGKCSLVCPTCFCFDIEDKNSAHAKEGLRQRKWGSCFYPEFTEVAGGHKFLMNTSEKIYFWYYHKFVRIPDEFSLLGCVDCGRCTRVCPAGISLPDTIKEIMSNY